MVIIVIKMHTVLKSPSNVSSFLHTIHIFGFRSHYDEVFLECSITTGKAVKKFYKRSHWHCYLCTQLFRRISAFRMHLSYHEKKAYPPLNKAPEDPAVKDSNGETHLSSKETGALKQRTRVMNAVSASKINILFNVMLEMFIRKREKEW